MSTRKRIILAVANGCKSTRQIASYLGAPLSTVNSYFYKADNGLRCFINGEVLQWSPGKANTLRLSSRAAITRAPDGQIKGVGLLADMNDLAGSYLTRGGK